MSELQSVLQQNSILDSWYGITPISEDENLGDELYRGLDKDALNTSYQDFENIADYLQSQEVTELLDIGSGDGRSLIHLGNRMKMTGVELHPERVKSTTETLERNNIHARVLELDLNRDELPYSQSYYLYFPTGEALDFILCQMYQRRKENFWLVAMESHGDLIETLSQQVWLDQVHHIPSPMPRHKKGIYFFRPNTNTFTDNPKDQLLQWSGNKSKIELIVQDGNQVRYYNPIGIDRAFFPRLFTKYPANREFHWDQIIGQRPLKT